VAYARVSPGSTFLSPAWKLVCLQPRVGGEIGRGLDRGDDGVACGVGGGVTMSRSPSPDLESVLPSPPAKSVAAWDDAPKGIRSMAWGDDAAPPLATRRKEPALPDLKTGQVEHLRWTFAIILRPIPTEGIPSCHATRGFTFKNFVLHTCVKIANAGLDLQVVPRTDTSNHKVILLLRCPEHLFIREYRKLVLRRWRQTGEGVTFRPIVDEDGDGIDDHDGKVGHGQQGAGLREELNPTEADRIQLTAMLLAKHQGRGGCGFGNIEHREADPDDDPRIVSIFPLHNKQWIRRVTAQWVAAFSLKARVRIFRTAMWDKMKDTCSSIRSCGSREPEEPAFEVSIGAEPQSLTPGYDKDSEDFEERDETARRKLRAYQDHMLKIRRSGGKASQALSRTKSKAVQMLAKQLRKPRGVPTAHENFLTSVNGQYGERFAFLFAFNTCCSQSFVVLILISLSLEVANMFNQNSASFWEFYLQATGIIGLLIPCVWGPAFLSQWDRMSFWYSNLWGSVGVTSIPAPNPFYREQPEGSSDAIMWIKTGAVHLLSLLAVIVALVAMCGMNLIIMEMEVLVQTAPLCGSWFYETVWKDFIRAGAKHSSSKTSPLVWIVHFVPSCYGGYSEEPWDFDFASGWSGSGKWLHRGLMVACVGAIEGLLIGLVYTEVFTCLALKLAHMRNKRLVQEHEACVINYTYPFEAVGFMAYFWVLAFLFIPASTVIQAHLATHEHGVAVLFNTTTPDSGAGVLTTTHSLTPRRMIEVWMDDKRFKNQVGPMLLLPVLVGLQIPMLFEYFLPAMCVSWQRANRQTQADEAAKRGPLEGGRCSRFSRRCRRWCCTAKCCCSLCRMCRCCILMCNCCMCDKDRGTSRTLPDPALPGTYTDVQLAKDITDRIHSSGTQPNRHRMVVTCHPKSLKQHVMQQQERAQQQRQDQEEKDGLEDDPETSDADYGVFQLHSADDIIVESMLDPLDLPNEYRKVCLIVLLVCMWTGVNLLIPLIGWCSLLIRFKFNFIRLVTYAKRPVPQTPNSSDSTGGYRPWLEGQIFLSTVVNSLLFCLSTGQLEAWWTLYDRNQCQPPKLNETRWKYPDCDLNFESGRKDELYDEASSVAAFEPVGITLAAPNTSCWQDPVPELNTGCPFAQENLDDWEDKSSRTPEQSLHRVVCFVILENVQVMLLYAMIKWNQSKNGNVQEKWRAARLAQHSLIAEQLFPPSSSDKVFSVVGASRAHVNFKAKLQRIRGEAPPQDKRKAKANSKGKGASAARLSTRALVFYVPIPFNAKLPSFAGSKAPPRGRMQSIITTKQGQAISEHGSVREIEQ
jgi:hypothetical protein